MGKLTKRQARVHALLEEYAKVAYPDAKDIPEDPEAAEAMQREADRHAARVLDEIIREGLI